MKLVLNYFRKGRISQSGLRSYSHFLSLKQRIIIRDTCTKNVRPIDEVNIMIEYGRYTIYVDNGTALFEIAVLKRYD